MKFIIIPDYPRMSGRHRQIAAQLAENGHEVHYMMWEMPYNISAKQLIKHLATSLFPKVYTYESFTVHKISRLPFFWPHVNGWLFKWQLKRLYRKADIDLIFTEGWSNETEVPKSLPFIYDLADDYAAPADVYGSPIYKLAFKLLGVRKAMDRQCRNALAVTAVSEVLVSYAKQRNDKVINLPNGVDGQVIEAVRKDTSTYPTNLHSLVYASGFGRWSRVTETMEAVRDLRAEFPDIDLTMAGGGPEEGTIKRFIAENQADEYIHFLGAIYDRKRWFSVINKGAIGLNISDKNKWRDAAHPIKVLEYSAMAKPVISTDLTEVEALSLSNVYIFSDTKGDGLVATMRRALKDSEHAASYEAISKQVIKEYNWQKIVDDLLTLAEPLLKDHSK
jgi:glycosyltransferase involved in cell wall biosynthesis